MKHYGTTKARKHWPGSKDDLPISEINANSTSFEFLKDEPDLYSLKDLKKHFPFECSARER